MVHLCLSLDTNDDMVEPSVPSALMCVRELRLRELCLRAFVWFFAQPAFLERLVLERVVPESICVVFSQPAFLERLVLERAWDFLD